MEDEGNLPLLSEKRSSVLDFDVASQTIRKLDRRFLILLVVVVLISYADRSNIGFAAQDLCTELHLTNEEYGRGVSLFYVGYLPTQVIGNTLLRRFGVPFWFSFIVFSWGCVALSMGFIRTATHFYILRTLLGVAEGGTFPAVWYTISLFYPPDHVTRAYGVIASAVFLSIPVASPISAGLLSLGTYVGVERWRLLFVVGGLVPILFSVILYFLLPASPETASFLEAEQREWIVLEHDLQLGVRRLSFWQEVKSVFANGTWRMCTLCSSIDFAIFSSIVFWATLLVIEMLYGEDEDDEEDKETCGSDNGNEIIAVLVTGIPFLVAGIACLLGRRYGIRNRSLSSSIFYGITGLALLSWAGTPSSYSVLRFLLFICATTADGLAFPKIAGLAITSTDVAARSTASALFNMFSTLSGVVSPLVFGKLMDVSGPKVAMSMSGGGYLLVALLVFSVRDPFVEEATERGAARGSPV